MTFVDPSGLSADYTQIDTYGVSFQVTWGGGGDYHVASWGIIRTQNGELGFIQTTGSGESGSRGGFSLAIGPLMSNAKTLQEIKGPFAGAGASAKVHELASLGFDLDLGRNLRSRIPIVVVSTGVGIGLNRAASSADDTERQVSGEAHITRTQTVVWNLGQLFGGGG